MEVVFQRWKVLMSSLFLQAIFSWSQIIPFFSFSTVSKTIFLESLSPINTHRSWYNLCFFGSFHFLKRLSFSLLSVLIMFVNEIIFLTIMSGGYLDSLHQQLSRDSWFNFQHIFSLSQTSKFFLSPVLHVCSLHQWLSWDPWSDFQQTEKRLGDTDFSYRIGKTTKRTYRGVFCFCAKHAGQVRFFGVYANITLASK